MITTDIGWRRNVSRKMEMKNRMKMNSRMKTIGCDGRIWDGRSFRREAGAVRSIWWCNNGCLEDVAKPAWRVLFRIHQFYKDTEDVHIKARREDLSEYVNLVLMEAPHNTRQKQNVYIRALDELSVEVRKQFTEVVQGSPTRGVHGVNFCCSYRTMQRRPWSNQEWLPDSLQRRIEAIEVSTSPCTLHDYICTPFYRP